MKIKSSHLYWQIPIIFIGVASFLYLLFSMLPEYTILRNVFPSKENKTVSEEVEKEITNEVEEEKEEELIEEYSASQLYSKDDTVGEIFYKLTLDPKKEEYLLDIEMYVNMIVERLSFEGPYQVVEEGILQPIYNESIVWNVQYKQIHSNPNRFEIEVVADDSAYMPGLYSKLISSILPKPGLIFISQEENSSEWCEMNSKEYEGDVIPQEGDSQYYNETFFKSVLINNEKQDIQCNSTVYVSLRPETKIMELSYRVNNDEGRSLFYGTYKISDNKLIVSYDKGKYGDLGNIQFDMVKLPELIGNIENANIIYSGDSIPSLNFYKGDIFLRALPD